MKNLRPAASGRLSMPQDLAKSESAPATATSGRRATSGFGLAVWATWVFVVIAVGRLGEIIPGLGSLPIAKVAVAFAVMAIAFEKRKVLRTPMRLSAVFRNARWLLVLAIVLIPFSIYISNSVKFILFTAAVVSVGFVLVVRACVNWEVFRGTLMALVVSATLLALGAIATFSGGRVAVGSSYDTNDLAYVLVTILPIAASFAIINRGGKRLIFIGICGLLVLTSLLTQSRGGLIGLATLSAMLVFRQFPYSKTNRWFLRGVFVAIFAAVAWTQLPQDAKERFSTMLSLESDYNLDASNTTGRTDIWKRNLRATVSRPIGFGIDSFILVDARTGGRYKVAHNSLVQVTVELGFLGLMLFLRQYWLSWRALKPIVSEDLPLNDERRHRSYMAFGLQLSLVANVVTGFFLSQAYSNLVWIMFAVVTAAELLHRTEPLGMRKTSIA